MKYTVKKQTGKVVVTFKVTAEEWAAETEAAYQKNKGKYNIQGFRKGHAPRKVLEKMYGEGLFVEDAFQNCVPKLYEEFLDKNASVEPVDRPEIDVVSLDEKGLVFTATVTVKPEVELGEYKGLTIKRNPVEVTDEEIDGEVKAAAEKNARFIEVTDRAAKSGDEVVIDYSGSVDGKKFDGGTAEKQTLLLGSHTFIPGFEEQVEGMSIGEERDINVKFPDDYHAENLKGKDSVFHIKLHGIRFKELPAIDDEFAKDVSEFDTLADYKKDIEKRISERKNAAADTDAENRLLQMIVDKCKVEIPQCMIETQIDNYIREFQYSLTYQGLKIEDYLKYTNTTMESLRDNYREKSAQAVKTRLVMEAIVKAEKIKCDAKTLNKKIKDFAEDIKRDFKEYKESLNERQLGYFENEVITDKLLEMLKKENTIEA
ncbi:MAG: trigger factor [Christensenellales bacterium]|nr:trigger factor [Clostridia bacterium]